MEPAAIQGGSDPDGGQIILQVDQGAPGNDAVAQVAELATLGVPRVVDASTPNPAFPTFGDLAGGFEVYISGATRPSTC